VEGVVTKVLPFIVAAVLSGPAYAQTPGRLDPSAISRAVAAAASSPSPSGGAHVSRGRAALTGAIIGGGIGVVSGWWLWKVTRDCGGCGPGPRDALISTGLLGAGIGAWIGVAAAPDRRPGIPLGRHVAAAPAVSRSRTGGAVTIAF
jgi:hypothetical protein